MRSSTSRIPRAHAVRPDRHSTISNDYSYAAHDHAEARARNSASRIAGAFARATSPTDPTAGLSGARIGELYREADAILNVCGEQELNDDLLPERCHHLRRERSRRGADPRRQGDPTPDRVPLAQYHALFTFGENIGTAGFPCPLHQFQWLPTRQPIVTDFWKTDAPPPAGAVFTSVANWNTSG